MHLLIVYRRDKYAWFHLFRSVYYFEKSTQILENNSSRDVKKSRRFALIRPLAAGPTIQRNFLSNRANKPTKQTQHDINASVMTTSN